MFKWAALLKMEVTKLNGSTVKKIAAKSSSAALLLTTGFVMTADFQPSRYVTRHHSSHAQLGRQSRERRSWASRTGGLVLLVFEKVTCMYVTTRHLPIKELAVGVTLGKTRSRFQAAGCVRNFHKPEGTENHQTSESGGQTNRALTPIDDQGKTHWQDLAWMMT